MNTSVTMRKTGRNIAVILVLLLLAIVLLPTNASAAFEKVTVVNPATGEELFVNQVDPRIDVYYPTSMAEGENVQWPLTVQMTVSPAAKRKPSCGTHWGGSGGCGATENEDGSYTVKFFSNCSFGIYESNNTYHPIKFKEANLYIADFSIPGDRLEIAKDQTVTVIMENGLGKEIENAKIEILAGTTVVGTATQNIALGSTTADVTCDYTGKNIAVGDDVQVTAKVTWDKDKELASQPKTFTAFAEEIYDTSWYNTTDTEFTISTKEQLIGLGRIVNGTAKKLDRDNFAGKTIKLAGDIDMGAKSIGGVWSGVPVLPIGLTFDTAFAGTFDGCGHAISNFYCEGTDALTSVGLFGYLTGTVRNLYMESGYVVSEISTISSIGGIAGVNYGLIENCGNGMNVKGTKGVANSAESTGSGGIAGVVGSTYDKMGGVIKNCYNTGKIENLTLAGGIAGGISDKGTITHCYNTGAVYSSEGKAGGIAGRVGCGRASGPYGVYNSYNISVVDGQTAAKTGAIAAEVAGKGEIINCYGRKGTADVISNSGVQKSELLSASEMKTADFVTRINGGVDAFVADTNTNNGYPILAWMKNTESAPVYTITCNAIEGGTYYTTVANAPLTGAAEGNTVAVVFTFNMGKGLASTDALSVTYGSNQKVAVTRVDEKTYTFVMPKGDVTIAPTVSDVPYVKEMTVSAAQDLVAPGGTVQFTAAATGLNDPPQTFTWKVEGAASASTAIDANGLLTVGADETAVSLDVTATSTVTTTRSATAAVVVGTLWEGEGTQESPYLIKTVDDLKLLGALCDIHKRQEGKFFALANDIDFEGVTDWSPLGGSYNGYYERYNEAFAGSLDGEGYSLKNFNIKFTATGLGECALFDGIAPTASIANLTISGDVTGTSFCGFAVETNGTLENCAFKGTITVSGEVYGIARTINESGVVNNCHFDGTIVSGDADNSGAEVAGICMYNKGTLKNCTARGSLSGAGKVAGIVIEQRRATTGSPSPYMEKCINYADILKVTEVQTSYSTGTSNSACAAGIIADISEGDVKFCENYGDIVPEGMIFTSQEGEYSLDHAIGGIAGSCHTTYSESSRFPTDPCDMEGCYNYGKVGGEWSSVGGIISRSDMISGRFSLTDCANYGDVFSTFKYSETSGGNNVTVGGIFGHITATGNEIPFTNVKNYGNVTAVDDTTCLVGGIIGNFVRPPKITFTSVANSGAVKSGYIAGGLLGHGSTGKWTVVNAYNTGSVETTGADGIVGGIIGAWSKNTWNEPGISMTNVYNAGAVTGAENATVNGIIGDIGVVSGVSPDEELLDTFTYDRVYFLAEAGAETTQEGFLPKTEDELKSAEFLALLNAGSETGSEPFQQGAAHFMNGYHPLTWETIPEKEPETPTINSAEGVEATLSEDGTVLTITVSEGYLLKDVVLNGESLGSVTTVENLKTGDTVTIEAAAIQTPTVRANEGGTYALSADGTVLTVTPDEGYYVKRVKLNGASLGSVTTVENLKTGDVVEVTFLQTQDPISKDYIDVPADKWYADAVKAVTEKGLFQGISETEFGPDVTMTRAMFITVLGRIYENEGNVIPEGTSDFTDVRAGSYYERYVIWAADNDIVKGVSPTEFAPETPVTREQMAVFMYRFTQYMNADVSGSADLSGFADSGTVSSWAQTAMKWAVSTGLINGVDKTHLDPQSSALRSHVAMICYRFDTLILQ